MAGKPMVSIGELNGKSKLRCYRNGLLRVSTCLRHSLLKMSRAQRDGYFTIVVNQRQPFLLS
jgi:hypothetical protein